MKKLFILVAIVLCTISTHAQAWSGIIDPSRAIDWSLSAGLPGSTLPDAAWTQCGSTITPSGTYLSPIDLNALISSRLTTCSANQYILIQGPGVGYSTTGIDLYNGGGCNGFGGPSSCRQSNIVIRGSGQPYFYLVGSSTSAGSFTNTAVHLEGGNTNPAGGESNVCDWTGGYAKSATVIQLGNCGSTTPALGSVSNLAVNSLVVLDQVDEATDTALTWNCATNGVCADSGSSGFTRNDGTTVGGVAFRSQSQGVRVTAMQTTGTLAGFTCTASAPCLTISPGLRMPNWTSVQKPQAWFGPYVQNVGVEGITFDFTYAVGLGQGANIYNCYKCWFSGVGMLHAPRSHIELYMAWNPLVKDSYFYQNSGFNPSSSGSIAMGSTTLTDSGNTFSSLMTVPGLNRIFVLGAGPGGVPLATTVTGFTNSGSVTVANAASVAVSGVELAAEEYQHSAVSYGVEEEYAFDPLVQNIICQQVTDSCPNNDGNTEGAVAGYNYSVNNVYTSVGWMQASFYRHASGDQFNLDEGNIGTGYNADNIHGTHAFGTILRDYLPGQQAAGCAGASCDLQTNAINLNAGVRYFNVLGSILGQSGYHSIYTCNATSTAPCNGNNGSVVEIILGYTGNGGSVASPAYAGYCSNTACSSIVNYDPLVATYLFRWGNCDAVNGFLAASCQFNSAEVPSGISPYSNAVPASHTLPCSFYLSCSGKPSWWGSGAFPGIGPDVSGGNIANTGGLANQNPAMACFLSLGGATDGSGGPITFIPCNGTTPTTVSPSSPFFAGAFGRTAGRIFVP